MDLSKIEKYSEKSQEFKTELEGEFLPEIFDELTNKNDFTEGIFENCGTDSDIDEGDNSSFMS